MCVYLSRVMFKKREVCMTDFMGNKEGCMALHAWALLASSKI